MKKFRKLMMTVIVSALMFMLVACGQSPTQQNQSQVPSPDVKPVMLTVSAAASLKDAMEEIKTAYTEEKTNVTITYNFGSSGSLQQQIEQGAEVDIFLSAATKQMDALSAKGLIKEDTRKNFLENKIVLVVPKDSTTVADFKDLATDKVKQIGLGEVKSVPVGQYAVEMLTKLDLFASVESKAVYGKDVKEVLTWVETGNVDAGIVYKTDALVSDKVKVIAEAPEGSVSPVYYPAAVIGATKNAEEAKAFIDYLYSSNAKPVFEKYGFKFME